MSSSRSIAAARNRRAGDSAIQTKMPTKQPSTSINSQRAFAPQPNYGNNANEIASSNNKLPFAKLTVSDAVGLITLRLGKVEQYLIDLQNSEGTSSSSNTNDKGIDNSVITTIVNRLDALEKKNLNNNQDIITNLTKEMATIKQSIQSLNRNMETMKVGFNNKFSDIEFAFAELEKTIDGDTNRETNVETIIDALAAETNSAVEETNNALAEPNDDSEEYIVEEASSEEEEQE